ncbi:PAS domain-containing protein [Haloplanus rallus]|uniref:histidine kinase n=1 Tax=Haloplanus rallus TaxID=1816183 RepID=A0A6B9F214_9EURY|nr:PAS domain-containing protein [Haloplanus rallus]QGX94326.1 PAS domain-containing protein [Haloplanus rallus]
MSATDTFRLLHVDDDPAVLDLTSSFLDRELGWEVTTLTETSPEAALSRVADDADADVDCIISDYDMPAMDGLAFFEAVREHGITTPFILYTGKGSEEIASRALNAGVTGYFQKGGPDQQRRLANRVEQVLDDRRTQAVADRYSTVIEALGYPVYVVDADGRFEFVNESFAELTGYDRETIIGSLPSLIKDDAAVERAESELGGILSADGPDSSQFEVDIVPKEGDPIRCRDHMAALPYDGECFEGSVGILRDVSAERRRRRELDYRTRAMDEAPTGITMTDPSRADNPMIYVNDAFVEMTGYDREAALDRNCRFLQGPDTDSEPVETLNEAIEAGEPATVTLRNYRRDGEPFWNRVSIAPLRDDDGEVARWVGFQEDVTEYRRYRRRLERQNERLERFAGVLSHDLRNPLTVAAGELELAKCATEAGHEHLDAVADAHARIEALIDDLLTLARDTDGDMDREALSLPTMVTRCWSDIETRDATLRVETERTVNAESRRFRRLLTNLLGNAVEHGGDDVVVTVGETDGGFYVADDGPGIPESERDRIFEAGYSTDEGGTGFGLEIVREFVDVHGWTVDVTESADGGARFDVRGVDAT